MRKKSKIRKLFGKRISRGFTLVEVVISTVLLGILVVGVVAFSGPILSMISTQESNARATMLAENINSFLVGNLSSATNIVVIENGTGTSMTNKLSDFSGSNATAKIFETSSEMKALKNVNVKEEEIRCIGLKWFTDGKAKRDEMKLFLTSYNVLMENNKDYSEGFYLQSVSAVNPPRFVFDHALYEGLYPVVKIEKNSYAVAGTDVDKLKTHAVYKITTQVYTNYNCYDVANDARAKSAPIGFTGISYVECRNMPYTKMNDSVMQYSSPSYSDLTTFKDANGTYFAPDMFIFFTVPKTTSG